MVEKMMSREVTKTTVKLARIETVDGLPQAVELEPVVLIGNINHEKAQKSVNKMYDFQVTVISVEADTLVYEMPVARFIDHASIKAVKEGSEQEELELV